MLKSYKYRIFPSEKQKQQLDLFFNSTRFIYNLGLETKVAAWTCNKTNLSCFSLIKQMKELKDTDATWLKECPSQMLQMSLRNLDNAYTKFFKGGNFPKFKSKKDRQSIQFPQWVKYDFNKGVIYLPKLRAVPCVFHRKFEGLIKTTTVSKTKTNKYFVSILVDNQNELPAKKPILDNTSIGIDLGIKTFATLSNGVKLENPKFLEKSIKRIKVEQRKLSKKIKKGPKPQSKRYEKQRIILAKIYEKVRNRNVDYLHKLTSNIIHSYDTICLETLNTSNMVKINKNLSPFISRSNWGLFKLMLEYKARFYGKNIVYIGEFFPSSKICSDCGSINTELSLTNRNWSCKSCGCKHDRDINAAKNIKNFGLRDKPSIVNVGQ